MEHVNNLGGAAPGQFNEKRIGGVTVGIREADPVIGAATQLHRSEVGIRAGSKGVESAVRSKGDMGKLDRAGLLMIGEADADKVMEKSWMNSQGFVDLMVHGKTIQALVDTGATHNFMMTRLAKEAGLTITPSNMEVKAVNSRAKVVGLVHEVPVQMKDWKGQLDFTVMEMNDFDMILGQDFLKGNKAIVVPFCDEVVLVGQTRTWTLPTHR